MVAQAAAGRPVGAVTAHRVLVTGAAGYLGSTLVESLAQRLRERRPAALPPAPPAGEADRAQAGDFDIGCIVATDIREIPEANRLPGVEYVAMDVRDRALADTLRQHAIDTVVHLAAIVTPGPKSNRELEYSVDVLGTRNVLEACVAAGVGRIIVTSSGAAYGYHADNSDWLTEDDPVRGNEAFAYSHHKRLVEEMLAEYRAAHPDLRQVVFRVGTILGETTRNQITALFERPRLIAIRGSASPFVFIWDQDVVGAIEHAIFSGRDGIYNVAGDGALGIQQIAALLGKRCVTFPPGLLRAVLAVLHPLGLSRYGPEQVDFLRYRPVLDNRRLKEVFGYVPQLSVRAGVRTVPQGPRPGGRLIVAKRSFAGAVVMITGAGGGLGRALALRFAAAGARIAALDRDPAGLDATRSELESRGVECLALTCDVTDAVACSGAVAATVARFGSLDVLVANAGISHRSAFAATGLDVIRRVMEVNFFGAVNCTAAALPQLLASRGLVIAVSSVAGFTPLVARTGYSASKHAMHGFFDSLRAEVEAARRRRDAGLPVVHRDRHRPQCHRR